MRRLSVIICCLLIFNIAYPVCAQGQPSEEKAYQFYMRLGKFALDEGDYQEAYGAFYRALSIKPDEEAPHFYMNLLKRLYDERVEPPQQPLRKRFSHKKVPAPADLRSSSTQTAPPSAKTYELPGAQQAQQIYEQQKQAAASSDAVVIEAVSEEPAMPVKPSVAAHVAVPVPSRSTDDRVILPAGAITQTAPKQQLIPQQTAVYQELQIVYLDDALFQTQPKTLLRVELNASLTLSGSNIQRFLVITPGFIEVNRINSDRIQILPKKRGATFLHVWDDRGRWTFQVEVILPIKQMAKVQEVEADRRVVTARPFEFSYSADMGQFYVGPSYNEMERSNLMMLQIFKMAGETPYGELDGHLVFNKYDQSTEITGYGLGLSKGHVWNFEDFNIRLFDLQKYFSTLTMPGQYVRGLLFEATAFHDRLSYAYMHGRDRAVYGYIDPNILDDRESFIEGFKLTLDPNRENNYSFNFTRGYGGLREDYLQDHVYSVEAQRRVKDVLVQGELGFNDHEAAFLSTAEWEEKDHRVNLSFRNIGDEYTTVSGYPGNRGEIGSSVLWSWRMKEASLSTYFDVYQEKHLSNIDHPDRLNYDFSSTLNVPVFDDDRWISSLYFINTPGELAPRNNLNLNTRYMKNIQMGDRVFSLYGGLSQQRSRYDLNPSSDFDRYSISTGFSVDLFKRVDFFANYEQSLVYEEDTGNSYKPHVMNMGISHSKQLRDDVNIYSALYYRDEENTTGTNSFLAGEDSVTASVSLNYRPHDDIELYLDMRTRDVWEENNARDSYNDLDVRFGVRMAWGSPIVWNPSGFIQGYVYKDVNNNEEMDKDEPGLENVGVRVGNKQVTTNERGFYKAHVYAKSVEVSVDMATVPDGFIFTTPMLVDMPIKTHGRQNVDFGLNAQSGIYGIVYYDQNKNGRPDAGDQFIRLARIMLDGDKEAMSDFEGVYTFENVEPGTHEITIDVNALPIEYLPEMRIKQKVEIFEGATYTLHVPLKRN